MNTKHGDLRSAFTLVELLVVIAVIGVLVGLLLPAVQAAREAARKMQCSNNLKQIGLELHNYHGSHRKFPFGTNWDNQGPNRQFYGLGWSGLILPQLEQGSLYDKFDYDKPPLIIHGIWTEHNGPLGATKIVVYGCPSDPQDELVLVTNVFFPPNGPHKDDDWYRMSYSGVADSRTAWIPGGNLEWYRRDADGMMMDRNSKSFGDVSDGTSNTLFIGEVTADRPGSRRGYAWPHGPIHSTAAGINGPGSLPGDGIFRNMGDEGFSSFHSGGCHFVMVDGSVQFLSENIDANTLKPLTTRAGGEVVPNY